MSTRSSAWTRAVTSSSLLLGIGSYPVDIVPPLAESDIGVLGRVLVGQDVHKPNEVQRRTGFPTKMSGSITIRSRQSMFNLLPASVFDEIVF